MNESQKNIETCLPEDILAEVAGVPTDAHFRSLVDEALDPLKQQAATQAGWDDYNEVVLSHQPYTFTSSVRQMKSNLILLLRRLWRFPFGRGTSLSDAGSLRSLADMWSHYISRLQGNATYGIPSRLDQLTDLPSAPLLLSDRKISGVPEAADGMSVAHLIGTSQRLAITELTDNNEWSESVTFSDTQRIFSIFPNIESIELGIKELTYSGNGAFTSSDIKEIKLPHLEVYNGFGSPSAGTSIINGTQIEELDLSALKVINRIAANHDNAPQIASNCSTLKYVDLSGMTSFMTNFSGNYPQTQFSNCPNIEIIKVGRVTSFTSINFTQYAANQPMTKLIRLEFGAGTAISLNLAYWNPSVALDASRTDLIEEGSTAANNLEQFLSNFKAYIALRLTDNGAGKTLTLSQAVFSAVIEGTDPICNEIKDIILVKGWKVQDTNNNKFPT